MKLVPYKRIGEVEEIGRAAVWLASDFTDYIVGTTLFIDGGMTLVSRLRDGRLGWPRVTIQQTPGRTDLGSENQCSPFGPLITPFK